MNREFLMLAKEFDSKKHTPAGWFLSEKLDGMRAFWDGGITAGMPKCEVPWANLEKDERYVDEQISTGLWSRYGNVLHAPDGWTEELPCMFLDGELYTPSMSRQQLMSVVKQLNPGEEWNDIPFNVWDIPHPSEIFAVGRINNPNFRLMITPERAAKAFELVEDLHYTPSDPLHFSTAQLVLKARVRDYPATIHPQEQLPYSTERALKILHEQLDKITREGGEGVMLRHPSGYWRPKRSKQLLKVKKLQDSEAKIIGFTTGRRTDRGSKLLGKMGAMIVDWEGKVFELSGFTDEERELDNPYWAEKHPGEKYPHMSVHFTRGQIITFTYRGLTDDGIPQEARYLRPWEPV